MACILITQINQHHDQHLWLSIVQQRIWCHLEHNKMRQSDSNTGSINAKKKSFLMLLVTSRDATFNKLSSFINENRCIPHCISIPHGVVSHD